MVSVVRLSKCGRATTANLRRNEWECEKNSFLSPFVVVFCQRFGWKGAGDYSEFGKERMEVQDKFVPFSIRCSPLPAVRVVRCGRLQRIWEGMNGDAR